MICKTKWIKKNQNQTQAIRLKKETKVTTDTKREKHNSYSCC